MKFINVFIRRPVFTSMLFLSISVLGIISFLRLPFDLLPDITIPKLTVVTHYKGASPEIIEREITKRIEEAATGISGIQDVRSVSTEGNSIVTLFFRRGTDLKMATLRLRERLDEVSWQFPKGTSRPNILRTGPTSTPVMGIWVRGDRELIKRIVVRRLEQIDGVGEARLLGIQGKEILIRMNPDIMQAYNIGLDDIRNTLLSYNIVMPLGLVKQGNYTFPLRFISETETAEKIGNLPLLRGKIRLKDISQIQERTKKKDSEILFNGKRGYLIQIYREWKKNTVVVSRNVREILEKIRLKYPDLEYNVTYDDAKFIESAFINIIFSLIFGGILAFFALSLFTGNVRIPFVLSLSMPLSIIPSFFLFYLFRVNINIMSLSGLALAIGMLVDSSIVVLENIITRKNVIEGSTEVGLAVVTSILTTVAVFFPIIYIHGIAGMMLKPLSFAVISTLLISLFVAFSLLPLLASRVGGISEGESKLYISVKNGFNVILEWAYKKRGSVYLIALLLFLAGIVSFIFLKKEAVPSIYADREIRIELPYDSDIAETEAVVKRLTMYIRKKNKNVKILSKIGKVDPFGISHTGSAILRISRLKKRIEWGKFMKSYRNISFSVSSINPVLSYFENTGKVTIRIPYTDFAEEGERFSIVSTALKGATFPYNEEIPVIELHLRQIIADRLHISTRNLFSYVKASLSGTSVLDVERGEEKLTIMVRMGDKKNLDKLLSIKYRGLPIKELFDVKRKKVPRGIIRFNGRRCIEGILPYSGRIKMPHLPFDYEIGGEIKEYRAVLTSAVFAFLVAIFLVYMILSSFYESFFLPIIIMISVPFAVAGGFLSLLLTVTSINVISLIGIVVLSGIVVNNAIVLLDQAERFRIKGINNPAQQAAKRRLRPILMTTFTTVAGLLPISIGATLQSSLGRSVIGGILISTFITLIFIPVVYDKLVS